MMRDKCIVLLFFEIADFVIGIRYLNKTNNMLFIYLCLYFKQFYFDKHEDKLQTKKLQMS